MKTNKRCIIGTLLLVVMLVALAVPAFATTRVLSLPSGQAWASTPLETRSGSYSYVLAQNESVYPNAGQDQYELIHCRILNSSGTRICTKEYEVLDETNSGLSRIELRQGYLHYTSIEFEFRGNSANAARAVVTYYPN